MPWTNYHSHTHYCDGKYAVAAYAEEAIRRGFVAYGFSSHAPLPFDRAWAMHRDAVIDYATEVAQAKAKYIGQIQLYYGLEVDYIPGVTGPAHPTIRRLGLDYTIGSVHFVDAFPDGEPWEIDGSHGVFLRGLAEIFGNDVRRAVSRYFELTRQMLTDEPPDVVGHVDKIKIQNEAGQLFSETADWYREAIRETLQCIAAAGAILEVNTRGIYKKKTPEFYPSRWVLAEARQLNIPVTINADSHHPDEMNECFADAAAALQQAGYDQLHVLLDDQWQARPFDANGIIP